jgi:FkbM family methyltransferase
MRLAGRSAKKLLNAALQKRHYVAATNIMRFCEHPTDLFKRYLFGHGAYPAQINVRTPIGIVPLQVYSHDDVLTLNETFCRHDYLADADDRIIVDFGSNIGISAAYFLSRSPEAFVHLYEPLPQNTDRLRANLAQFSGRYELSPIAVGVVEGSVEFGWEPTGRYGGVGQKTGNYIHVPCRRANDVLAELIERHGGIDILKIDIETLEDAVTRGIPPRMATRINKIFVEYGFSDNPLAQTHELVRYGEISQFFNKRTKVLSTGGHAADSPAIERS